MNPEPSVEQGAPRQGSGEMFDQIAERYDLLNRIMSLGIDRSWRDRAVARLAEVLGEGSARALDVATGTGDLAFLLARAYPQADVIGFDPSSGMLEVAKQKLVKAEADAAGLAERVRFVQGDAQSMPFADGSFDAVTIAFGIRNVPDRPKGLSEMARVLRPGGLLAVLELSEPKGGVMGSLARIHVHHVIPFVGSLLSGKKEYRYLQRSIQAFPPAEAFAEVIAGQGFEVCDVIALTFGTAHLYVARKVGGAS